MYVTIISININYHFVVNPFVGRSASSCFGSGSFCVILEPILTHFLSIAANSQFT